MANEIARKVNQHLSYATNLVDSAQKQSDRNLRLGLITSACLQAELALGFYVTELKGNSVKGGASITPLTPSTIKSELEDIPASNAREFLDVVAEPASQVSQLLAWGFEFRRSSVETELKSPLFATGEEPTTDLGGMIASSSNAFDNDSNYIGAVTPEQVKSVIAFVKEFIVRQRQNAEEY